MTKLKSVYGDKIYVPAREELIWHIVGNFNSTWFERLVDLWIGANTKPLLVNEIRDAAMKENSRSFNEASKTMFPKDSEIDPREDSIFTKDDISMMFGMLRKKMDGRVSDSEWSGFTDWVTTTSKQSKQKL